MTAKNRHFNVYIPPASRQQNPMARRIRDRKALCVRLLFLQHALSTKCTTCRSRMRSNRCPPVCSIGFNLKLPRYTSGVGILDHDTNDFEQLQILTNNIISIAGTHIQTGEIEDVDHQRSAGTDRFRVGGRMNPLPTTRHLSAANPTFKFQITANQNLTLSSLRIVHDVLNRGGELGGHLRR